MRQTVAALFLLLLSACSPREVQPVESSDGHYIVLPEISGDEAGPARRMCVRLRVIDQKTRAELVYQTGASDSSKWAIGWHGSVPILFSSDIGIYAYDIVGGIITERPASEEEKQAVGVRMSRNMEIDRHHKMKTEPNKAMEPTPVNVTVPANAGPAPFTSAAHL